MVQTILQVILSLLTLLGYNIETSLAGNATLGDTQYVFRVKNTAKRNTSSAVCAMLSFLFVQAWEMPSILHLSYGIQF